MNNLTSKNKYDSDLWLNIKKHGVSGSDFETEAVFNAGSREIKVADVGDFAPGQGIVVSGNDQYQNVYLWSAEHQKIWQTDVAIRPIETMYHSVPCESFGKIKQHHQEKEKLVVPVSDEVNLRGYDGSLGPFTVFHIEIDSIAPFSFRWSDDITRTWKGEKVKITTGWQPLSAGLQIRFNQKKWNKGDAIVCDCRNSLISEIESINGKTIFLKDPLINDSQNAVVRHEDSLAFQKIMNRAVKENRNIYIPPGHYRLFRGISVLSALDIRIEGSIRERTILDMSEGVGACFWLFCGERVTIRNLKIIGHTSKEQGFPFHFKNANGRRIYRTHALKPARAVETRGTRQLLVEEVSVEKIACECFYSQAPNSTHYNRTESLVYLRCKVNDCGFNAFDSNNRNDKTSVLFCHITDVANCVWEGPGKRVKYIGNHIKDSGPCAIGGQTILEDNIFEGSNTGNAGVALGRVSKQVIIKNNVFIDYNTTAIDIYSDTAPGGAYYTANANIVVSGNIIDLTSVAALSERRCGICVGLSNVNISDNQIYTRNDCEGETTGILLLEPTRNIQIHDNIIQNCGKGIHVQTRYSFVSQITGDCSIKQQKPFLSPEDFLVNPYRDWNCFSPSVKAEDQYNLVDSYDRESSVIHLRNPHRVKPGEAFLIYHDSANWNVHDNTIDACRCGVVFDAVGGHTSVLKNNMITAPRATRIPAFGVVTRGRLNLLGNHITGFSSENSAGLYLKHYPYSASVYGTMVHDNIFSQCMFAVMEAHAGLWRSIHDLRNQLVDSSRETGKDIVPEKSSEECLEFTGGLENIPLKAVEISDAKNFPNEKSWSKESSISMNSDLGNWPVESMKAEAKAGWNDREVCIAARFVPAAAFSPSSNSEFGDWCKGDGMGIAFSIDSGKDLIKLFGLFDGTFKMTVPHAGFDLEKLGVFEENIQFSVSVAEDYWEFKWMLPLSILGFKPKPSLYIPMNIGFYNSKNNTWISWVASEEVIHYGYMFSNIVHSGKLEFVT
jgi:nitrous oxidase accessory protein NosD